MDRALFLKPTVSLVALAATLALLPATATAATTQITGTPMNVYVGTQGNIQAKLDTDQNRVFYPPGNDQGDAGLFLGFSSGPLLGKTYGPPGSFAMTATNATYTAQSQDPLSGSGSAGDPYQLVTHYKVSSVGTDYFTIDQTVRYVQGDKKFSVSYTINNITGTPAVFPLNPAPATDIQFRATEAADLYIEGSDLGTGLLDGGPPQFLAGVNNSVGRAGGIVEVDTSKWDAYQVANYQDLWSSIRQSLGPALDNTLVEDVVDDGAGVQWNGYWANGQALQHGDSVTFDVIWKFAAVVPLSLNPTEAKQSVGKTQKIAATATEVTGNPMVGKTVRYTVTGVNPGSGTAAAPTDSNGKAYVAYAGKNTGDDIVTVYIDINNNGSRDSNEPQLDSKVTWTPYVAPVPAISASIVVQGPFVVAKDGKVDVFLTCPSTASDESGCEGDVTGRLSVRKHAPHKSKSKSKKSARAAKKKKKKKVKPFKPGTRKYAIGPAHYKLDPKQNAKIRVAVSPEALKRLKKMKHAIVSFTARTTGKPPQSAIGTIRAAR